MDASHLHSPDTEIYILGLDPGLRTCGWGIIGLSRRQRGRQHIVASGLIQTAPAKADRGPRLAVLDQDLRQIAQSHPVQVAAVETTYVNKNKRTSLGLAEARGVVVAVMGTLQIPVFHYAPRTIKKTVTGHGGAPKVIVSQIVRAIFPDLGEKRHDETDAIATALCHAQHHGWQIS